MSIFSCVDYVPKQAKKNETLLTGLNNIYKKKILSANIKSIQHWLLHEQRCMHRKVPHWVYGLNADEGTMLAHISYVVI
jgi:hypothetical protein